MKKILLVSILLAALPLTASAHERHHGVGFSEDTSLDLDDGRVVITRDRIGRDEKVVITADGDLEVNGRDIDVDADQRAALVRFHRETVKLEKMADEIGDDAGDIAAASTAYAAMHVAEALRALGGDDDDTELDADTEALAADFEERIEKIEEFADRIEDQADKVVDMAEDLQRDIPALRELDWFLDD